MLQLYCNVAWLQSWEKKTTVVSIIETDIFQNVKCGNSVGFPKSGHILQYVFNAGMPK